MTELFISKCRLEIKQSSEGTQEVPGLSEVPVYKTDEVWELLKSGSRARSVGSTNANELSSRSHWYILIIFYLSVSYVEKVFNSNNLAI